MFNICFKECFRINSIIPRKHGNHLIHRSISGSEIAAALRPFYFVVHPDLFGRFPEQRAVNEDSLKHLSAHLEALQQHKLLTNSPNSLPFYVRGAENDKKGTFKLIKIPLERNRDPKVVLRRILESCSLPTEYVDKFKSIPVSSSSSGTSYEQRSSYTPDEASEEFIIVQRVKKEKDLNTLTFWMEKNIKIARDRSESLKELKDEVMKLQESLAETLKVKELRYECGWNVEHYRGCLKTLEKLAQLHKKDMKSLEGRTVVFAAFTGVSLEGHIMLFTGDVQHNWLELLRNIPRHDAYLLKIPAYEDALSQVLRKIRIKRRKFMPKTQAIQYTSHLMNITTALLDFLGKNKYPKVWPESMNEYEIVIESDSGPLMLSPTGQFISPARCPGSILVDFITKNLELARENTKFYKKNKYVERELHEKSILDLECLTLKKDDSVTPERMIDCLERLSTNGIKMKNLDLHITHYYSVLADGTVCIPYDWKL